MSRRSADRVGLGDEDGDEQLRQSFSVCATELSHLKFDLVGLINLAGAFACSAGQPVGDFYICFMCVCCVDHILQHEYFLLQRVVLPSLIRLQHRISQNLSLTSIWVN